MQITPYLENKISSLQRSFKMASSFDFIKLDSSSPNKPHLAAQYKSLRLTALQLSPDAFSSTYADESQYSDAAWLGRIFHPAKKTFICVDKEDGTWAAQVTLLGPITKATYTLPDEAGQPAVKSDDEEEKWQMIGLYTLPDYRGKGLGKILCKEAFKHLTETRGGPRDIRVRIMVKPQNTVTVRLYRSMGFVEAGMCTLEEALSVNGEDIPENPPADKYRTRAGYIMALQLERQ
ncbi:hypothetical protein B0T10DRAFT_490265 [Thelonectria olida]|uniref:N-acetyltransferase domain-containing protein n=1 Tax=Thelonectria olida TaxID=1576542 RepID=A0A9P9ARI5_9HYPO|nr:hypothetical protein B0T10DRAFT_490265 [Thelonectria olida]